MFTAAGVLASFFLLAGTTMVFSCGDNMRSKKNNAHKKYTVYQTGENSYLLISKKKRRKQKGGAR